MHALYVVSVWLHILAATVWVGGMLFLVLVVVPVLRSGKLTEGVAVVRETGRRFRSVAWICFAVVVATGSFNLWCRGVRLASFVDADWLSSPFGKTVVFKLFLFATVVLVSAVHDFVVGPQASAALAADPRSAAAAAARRRASLLGRINVVFALLLVGAGVALVRGLPF